MGVSDLSPSSRPPERPSRSPFLDTKPMQYRSPVVFYLLFIAKEAAVAGHGERRISNKSCVLNCLVIRHSKRYLAPFCSRRHTRGQNLGYREKRQSSQVIQQRRCSKGTVGFICAWRYAYIYRNTHRKHHGDIHEKSPIQNDPIID